MINFFRRVRRRLLVENRFSKYILYATGEIILVVIGILIALQFNNLNEERKLNNKAKNYLQALNIEIENNIFSIDISSAIFESDVKKSVQTLQQLNTVGAKTTTDDDLKKIIEAKLVYPVTIGK